TEIHVGVLATGASSAFTLTVAVSAAAVPSVTNSACVATAGDTNAANDCASDPTNVAAAAAPDLALAKSHAGSFAVGSNGSYTLTVENVGSASTSGVISVTDTLPAGLTFVSGAGAGWSFSSSGQAVTALHVGVLATGASSAFTLTVAVGPAAVPSVTNS